MQNMTNAFDPLEIKALKAGFAPKATALEAWEAIRRDHVFRTMPDPVARLCGQIYRNLELPAGHQDRDRLRGAFKSNHVYGTFQLAGVIRGLEAFEGQDIPYLIVKGAAIALHAETFGARRLGDIDVVVSAHDVERACEALACVGFAPKYPKTLDIKGRKRWKSIGPFINEAGAELDLMVNGTRRSDLLAIFLNEQPTSIEWMGYKLRVATPEQTLILSLVHGFAASADSDFVQSLADVLMLIKTANEKRLRELASQCQLSFMLDAALGRLFDLSLLTSNEFLASDEIKESHTQVRSRVLRRQGRNLGVNIAKLIRQRWRGLRPPSGLTHEPSVRMIAYWAWLVCFQFVRVERLLLYFLGSLVPHSRVIWLKYGDTLWIDADTSTWDFRFRLEWSESQASVVSLASDFDATHGHGLKVYESGRFRGLLPGPRSNPIILRPSGAQRALEISIRLPEHPMPEKGLRCNVTLE